LRFVSEPAYPNRPGAPAVVARVLRQMRQHRGHVFWPDDSSVLDSADIDTDELLGHGQVTDGYLLALALAHGGQLATRDKRLSVAPVVGGAGGLWHIEHG
jgi:hypothetical protein